MKNKNKNKVVYGWYLTNKELKSSGHWDSLKLEDVFHQNYIGETHIASGKPVPCENGFHGSLDIEDTFIFRDYAHDSNIMTFCEFSGKFSSNLNNRYIEKFCATKRRIIFAIDISKFVFKIRRRNKTIVYAYQEVFDFLNSPYDGGAIYKDLGIEERSIRRFKQIKDLKKRIAKQLLEYIRSTVIKIK